MKLIIAGSNFQIVLRENSASIRVILLGWVNKELAKKSEPTPTYTSERTYPKNILNKANKIKGIIVQILDSWQFK